MSIEILPDELTAYKRFIGLYSSLKEEKPTGHKLSELYEELAEAQRIAFSEIPVSKLARNITPFKVRIRNRFAV